MIPPWGGGAGQSPAAFISYSGAGRDAPRFPGEGGCGAHSSGISRTGRIQCRHPSRSRRTSRWSTGRNDRHPARRCGCAVFAPKFELARSRAARLRPVPAEPGQGHEPPLRAARKAIVAAGFAKRRDCKEPGDLRSCHLPRHAPHARVRGAVWRSEKGVGRADATRTTGLNRARGGSHASHLGGALGVMVPMRSIGAICRSPRGGAFAQYKGEAATSRYAYSAKATTPPPPHIGGLPTSAELAAGWEAAGHLVGGENNSYMEYTPIGESDGR